MSSAEDYHDKLKQVQRLIGFRKITGLLPIIMSVNYLIINPKGTTFMLATPCSKHVRIRQILWTTEL